MDAVAGTPRRGLWTRSLPFIARGAAWWVGALALLLFLVWTRVDIGGTWSAVHRKPLYLADFLMLYVLVAIGLNLISGYVGAASIGHIALFAVGAYTAAILMTSHGWNYWPAILAGGCVAAVVSVPVGLILLRLSGWYFSVITLLMVVVVNDFWIQQAGLTGGGAGIFGLTMPSIAGQQFDLKSYLYLIVAVNVAAFLLLRYLVDRTRWGRAFVAVRDVEPAARAVGIHPFMVRESTLAMSAFLAGLAGAMFAPLPGTINPDSFPILDSVFFLLAILAGGLGTTAGPVVGTVVLFSIPQVLSEQESLRRVSYLFYGVALLLIVIFLPEGMVGGIQRQWRRLLARPGLRALRDDVDRTPAAPAGTSPTTLRIAAEANSTWAAAQAPFVLEAAGIDKKFGDVVALSDVSVQVRPGTIHAIIGPNGSGKTTLLNIMSGFYRQDAGTIQVLGRPMRRGASARAIRYGIARTFQTQQVLPQLSVLENVMLGCHARGRVTLLDGMLPLPYVRGEERRARERALALLDVVGLGRAVAAQPCSLLPFAHQRLAELARALAGEPRVLLLDEPASGLAVDEVRAFAALVRRLKEAGLTIVLVEHNFGLVSELADTITVLDAGAKLAEGSFAEVSTDPAVIEAYLGA
jgi:branched-chain amino acid transport system permease protein